MVEVVRAAETYIDVPQDGAESCEQVFFSGPIVRHAFRK
jgi:hypothetical protein